MTRSTPTGTLMARVQGLMAVTLLVCSSAWADVSPGQQALLAGRYPAAQAMWAPLAQKGDADALCGLGNLYNFGLGVTMDVEKAAAFYRRAADKNHAEAQYRLAILYKQGVGVAQDFERAYRLYQQSALQGYLPAVYALALLHEAPASTPPAPATAQYQLIQFAAQAGFSTAQLHYSDWRPLGEAQSWMLKAAGQNDPAALRMACEIARWNANTDDPERKAVASSPQEEYRRAYLYCSLLERQLHDPYLLQEHDRSANALIASVSARQAARELSAGDIRQINQHISAWKAQPRTLHAPLPTAITGLIRAIRMDDLRNWD